MSTVVENSVIGKRKKEPWFPDVGTEEYPETRYGTVVEGTVVLTGRGKRGLGEVEREERAGEGDAGGSRDGGLAPERLRDPSSIVPEGRQGGG